MDLLPAATLSTPRQVIVPVPRPVERRSARPIVCAPVDERGDEDEVKLRFCLSQLDALQAAQRKVRNPWPSDDPVWNGQRPDEWNATMQKVFERCDLPADIVVTDCSEPPCVAALRALEGDEQALVEAIEGCAPFQQAFPDPEEPLVPFGVPCADGRWDRMILFSTFDRDQRRAYFEALGMQPAMDEERLSVWLEGYRILSRRADGLAGMWDCPPP